MANKAKEILDRALELPPVERAELIENLLTSFEYPPDKEIDNRWAREAEDRIEAYDAGKISSKSVQEVFDTLNTTSLNED